MNTKYKTPKRLKGFQDFFGRDARIRQYVVGVFREVYEKFGYEPLETPALEYSELILGQSGEEAEKQYYRFNDNGDRDVMLRFEVMISMCRAMAQNIANITLPYKRYQIQPVWRAENVQKGRYREFTQCDADTVGSASMTADAEFIQMGIEILARLGFKEFEARISNKKFLLGLAEFLGINPALAYSFQMSIDKLEKIGKDKVIEEMVNLRDIPEEKARKAMEMLDIEKYKQMNPGEIIAAFQESVGTTTVGKEALAELTEIFAYLKDAGVEQKYYRFDISIARGLASYTGPVWEYSVIDGGVGSVGGAGRYDNAIEKYLGKKIPATGGSFGLERICDIIKDRNMYDAGETPAEILVARFSEKTSSACIKLAQKLRQEGKKVMLYPDITKLGRQLKYADKKGIGSVVILGEDELAAGKYKIRTMENGEEQEFNL